jgi:WD40 repeat protein
MADVFISYSRNDRDFVRKLHDALAKLNRDAWVDWQDIPLTAEWLSEIYAGIDAADNFVFVISPDSVASATCGKEIAYASANNKRLIPILHRAVPESDIPETFAKINWILFRDSDDFESTFGSLVQAIDTDLDWKQAHTRLLVRAKEWENKAQEKSLLLRGKDLQEAEEWQGQAAGKQPKPTLQQSQYVLASRRAETRRQRVELGAVTFAFVLTVGLATAAWIQRNTARREAAIALSRQLAAQSKLALGRTSADDLAEAALLAVESIDRYPTLEGDQALRQALALLPSRAHKIPFPPGSFSALSPDGEYLGTRSDDGLIHIWRIFTGREVSHFKCPDCGLSLSTGAQFMALDDNSHIEVWAKADSSYQKTDFSCSIPQDTWEKISTWEVSPNGDFVVVGGDDQEDPLAAYVYRRPGRKECDFVDGLGDLNMMVSGIAFSSGVNAPGVALWGKTPGGEAWQPEQAIFSVFKQPNGKFEFHRVVDVGYPAEGMAISDTDDDEVPRLPRPGTLEFAIATGSTISVRRGAEELVRLPESSTSLAINRDRKLLIAVNPERSAITVWPLSGYRYVQSFKHDYHIDGIGLNSNRLVTITETDPQTGRAQVALWGLPDGKDLGKWYLDTDSGQLYDRRNRLTSFGDLNRATEGLVYTLGNSVRSPAPAHVGPTTQLFASMGPDPKLAVSSEGNRVGEVVSVDKAGTSVIKISTRAGDNWTSRSKTLPLIIDAISLSSDGKFLAVAGQNQLFVLDPGSLSHIGSSWLSGGASPVTSLSVTGAMLAAAERSTIRVWDWHAKAVVSLIEENGELPITNVVLSSDDHYLGVVENYDGNSFPGPWIARVYTLSDKDLMSAACSRLNIFLGNEPARDVCAKYGTR